MHHELNCSADELLLTEMIFNGLFNTLDVTQTVALLSCFVCDEKSSEMPKLTEALSGPLKQMQVDFYCGRCDYREVG